MEVFRALSVVGALGFLLSVWAANGFSFGSGNAQLDIGDPLVWALIISPIFAVVGLIGIIGWAVKRKV
jgi:hypothetical protein